MRSELARAAAKASYSYLQGTDGLANRRARWFGKVEGWDVRGGEGACNKGRQGGRSLAKCFGNQ